MLKRQLLTSASLLLMILCWLPATAQPVQGDTLTLQGRQVIILWGDHTERGYALGYLLNEPIRNVFEDYFLDYYLGGSATAYNYLRAYFEEHYFVEERYTAEAAGIIEGMAAAGDDLYCDLLERQIDPVDILVVNAIVDYAALSRVDGLPLLPPLGCSSLSSWGDATVADPLLQGDLAYTRLLDWSPHTVLHTNHLLVIHLPSEADEQPWVSFAFPGLIGALSAINNAGVGAFLNMGNRHDGEPDQPLHPALLSVRNGIEAADYNGAGGSTVQDVAEALSDQHQRSGVIIHALQTMPDAPCIIECNYANGTLQRWQPDNTQLPGVNLAATNHFRQLYPPVYCYRYDNIVDSLTADGAVSAARQWQLLGGAAGTGSNLQVIQYLPASGQISWAVSSPGEPAYLAEPAVYNLQELFDLLEEVSPAALPPPRFDLLLYPNPGNADFQLSFNLPRSLPVRLTVHDLLGHELARLADRVLPAGRHRFDWHAGGHPAGLYFVNLTAGSATCGGKLLLLK